MTAPAIGPCAADGCDAPPSDRWAPVRRSVLDAYERQAAAAAEHVDLVPAHVRRCHQESLRHRMCYGVPCLCNRQSNTCRLHDSCNQSIGNGVLYCPADHGIIILACAVRVLLRSCAGTSCAEPST